MTAGEAEERNCIPRAITPATDDADNGSMGMTSLVERSYRIGPDGRSPVCDTIAARADIDALRDALAWRRNALARLELQDADTVLVLRALMALEDMLDATSAYDEHAPLTLTSDQVRALCEIVGAYITGRDVESYQPPEERERIERLRSLAGRLMDCCSELATAHEQLRERELTV